MPEKQGETKHHQRVLLVGAATALFIGGVIMFIGFVIAQGAGALSHLLIEIGKVIVVTSIVGLIFEWIMHERFVDRVKEQVQSIEQQVRRLDDSVDTLRKTVDITTGAIESGLSAVYGERRKAVEEVGELLADAGPGKELLLLGISLGDFLCPHGHLYQATAHALNRGIRVKALIVDLESEAARTRAQWEESTSDTPQFGSAEWTTWYHSTRCYNELKTATDAARNLARQFAGTVGTSGGTTGTFEYQKYELSPLCFLAVYENTMFLESYHYAGRGGESPILRIAKSTSSTADGNHLFNIYARHFNVLWSLPRIEVPQEPKLILREVPPSDSDNRSATPGTA